ncbi:MFS transporter [Oceanobacillus longus]|uniref:MFS transporter n=1 Tax=Oceanobacillus longus TaxID=930120 RepID=A0ABV8GZ81_9BACI
MNNNESVLINGQIEKPKIRPIPIMASLLIGVFIGIFSQTSLNMGLSNIMDDFHVDASTVQWLTTGYILTIGVLVPISGVLYQWVTTRNLFIISLCFLMAGTIIAIFSFNFEFLLFARIIQAIGTGILLPLMMNVILVLFPTHKRGFVMGLMMLIVMGAPAIAPTIAGLLIEIHNWKGIFWFCIPLLTFSFIFGLIYMQNISNLTKPKVDIISIFFSTIGFGGIVFSFSSLGSIVGTWGKWVFILSLTIGILSLVIFSIRQFKLDAPMMDLRVFKFPMFALGAAIVFLVMSVNLSVSILMPMYLKEGLLLPAAIAGLIMLPGGVLNGVTALVFGRVFDRYGPKYIVRTGFLILIIMFFLFTTVKTTTGELTIILIHCCTLIGVALVFNPAQTNGLNQLPTKFQTDGTAVMQTMLHVAGAIGVALAISTMSTGQKAYLDNAKGPINIIAQSEVVAAGINAAFALSLFLSIIGFIISLFIKRVDV